MRHNIHHGHHWWPDLILIAGLMTVASAHAHGGETCRFTGTTEYHGHVSLTTDVTEADGVTRVHVIAFFEAKLALWPLVHYLAEETSLWRAGNLQQVAVNNRYLSGGQIVRQQWDVFDRGPHELQARRIQGKTLADFQSNHPKFVQHWDPATFGQPWLQDYDDAHAEPRHDLGLVEAAMTRDPRPPLALAFYWTRWLPAHDMEVSVFLPGFKSDRLAGLRIVNLALAPSPTLEATLSAPALDSAQVSTAFVQLTPDHHVRQLSFDLRGKHHSVKGAIHQEGCTGAPVIPSNHG